MDRSNFDIKRLKSAEKLKVGNKFIPCPIDNGDELFPNGIFLFNITKMLEYIKLNPDDIELVEINVGDFTQSFSSIDESHIDSVDVSKLVILAEISPGRFNLIDGNHRMEKARRLGINSIFAYKLYVLQHLRFLTKQKAYKAYIEYWNEKLK